MQERGKERAKAEEAHDRHEEHLNATNNEGFENSSFKHEDHNEGQKLRDVSDSSYKKDVKSATKAGKTDDEIASDRIRRG